MAKIWEPQPIEVYLSWVEALQNPIFLDIPLNSWEYGFVCDMRMKLQRHFNLSELQAKKLEDIYAAKTKL